LFICYNEFNKEKNYMKKFYFCPHCGNLVEMVEDSGQIPVCCGEPMKELVAKTSDVGNEKHVPVIKEEGNTITVTVGATLHPMLPEHHIQWIYILTDQGIQRKRLKAGVPPVAKFVLLDNEVLLEVYEYCNLHGLWKKVV
jgi:superoxide reductase